MSIPTQRLNLPSAHKSKVAHTGFSMKPATVGSLAGEDRVVARPNTAFFLYHHPAAWFVSTALDKVVFLPDVTMKRLMPGVNGIRTRKKNERVERGYEDAVNLDVSKGSRTYLDPNTIIPAHCLPPGVASGGYLREIECEHPITGAGGAHFREVWDVPTRGLPNEETPFEFQRASYEAYLRWLVITGIIDPMLPQIKARLATTLTRRVRRAESLQMDPMLRQVRIDVATERLRAAAAATAPTDDEPPKTTKGGKK